MTDKTREVLDGIKDRLTKATPGPWFLDAGGDSGVYTEARPSNTSSDVASAFRREDEAFIAAAPVDVARLTRAVEAVLGLHTPVVVYELDDKNGTWIYDGDERRVLTTLCGECTPEFVLGEIEDGDYDGSGSDADIHYPCPTVAAIEDALNPKEGQ